MPKPPQQGSACNKYYVISWLTNGGGYAPRDYVPREGCRAARLLSHARCMGNRFSALNVPSSLLQDLWRGAWATRGTHAIDILLLVKLSERIPYLRIVSRLDAITE